MWQTRVVAAGAIAILAAGPLMSQEERSHQEGEAAHHEGLHFSHPLFTESVSPDTKARLNLGREWEIGGTASELEVEAEYAFHRSFSIEISMPYVVLNPDIGTSENNVGNVEMALKLANFAFEEQGILLGYGVEFGVPSGDPVKGIGSDHIWEIEPFFNVGWKHGRVELVGFSIFGIPVNQDVGEEVETEFRYDLSALYHVSARVQTLVELNGEVGLSGDEAGQGRAILSPGLKVAPCAGSPLFFGVSVGLPISDDELDVRGLFSVFYHF